MIVTAPSVSVEAVAEGYATGLVGTIGVRVLDGQGNTTLARATSGILETPASSGIYTATFTAPATAGQYVVVWDDGATFASEQLQVTTDFFTVSAPSAPSLVTVAQVRAYLDKPVGDTAQDSIIADLIVRASQQILKYTDREFVLADGGSNPRTRTHLVQGYWRTRVVPVGDMAAAPTAVAVQDYDGAVIATLNVSTDLETRPLVRRAWEPITHLYMRSTAPLLDPTYRIQVTGTYGFPSVPADVQQATIVTVGTWLRRDVSAFSQTFALDEARIERPQALPQAVQRILDAWRPVGVA